MNETTWSLSKLQGHSIWIGETDQLKVTLIPGLGAKMISLIDKSSNREWLKQKPIPKGLPQYGESFVGGAGWDEMFPSIDACEYPEHPWLGTMIPDHGEVWALPWEISVVRSSLKCMVHGIRFPYHLTKIYEFISPTVLHIRYMLTNLSPFPFHFLWAAHPLFQVEESMEILVPAGINDMVVSYSHNERLGKRGDRRPWPIVETSEGKVRLDRVEPPKSATAEKYYFEGLPDGWAGLRHSASKEGLILRFPKDKLPYLGIWANYGGFRDGYTVALEPASAFLDDLNTAIKKQKTSMIKGNDTYEWTLELECLRLNN